MGGGSSPKPDKNIGIAALKSAETGEQLLSWMQDQSKITNEWAAEDRGRWNDVFRPMQDAYIAEAQGWDSLARKNERAAAATADVQQQIRMADGQHKRQAMALGVNPASGAFQSGAAKSRLDGALAAAGAGNLARRQVEQEADARKANAINLGSGLAVNPATSMSISNGAMQAGANGAMQGYGQQGSLLNTQYNQQMQSWQAGQQGLMGVAGGIGSIVGMLSTKKAKTDMTALPDGAALGAIRKMPVEKWRYKPGMGDGGQHIGPYAEDFAAATGQGDGNSIDLISMMGVTMGAIRDLDKEVRSMRKAA